MPTDWRQAFATFQGAADKVGNRALLVAVIGQAALDLAEGDRGAAAYFLGARYRHHLELVGLPADFLPAGVTRADLIALVERPASRRLQMSHNMSQYVTE